MAEELRCTILDVMESWPLKLRCQAADGIWQVALADDTALSDRHGDLEPGRLRPGMVVLIEGEVTGTRALVARRIDLS